MPKFPVCAKKIFLAPGNRICNLERFPHDAISRFSRRPVSRNDHAGVVATGTSILGCGVFHGWQHGFHDERIHTDEQRDHALNYVRENALRHGLVKHPNQWPWSSLRFPELIDETEPWW